MAYEFYITVEGARQGRLIGESTKEAFKDKIVGLAFVYEIEAPRVSPSGRTRGQRKHSPVAFVKPWGAASPQLYQALTTNEMLKVVLFEFVTPNAEGVDEVYHTVKLFDANILSIKQELNPSKRENFPSAPGIETIAMTFQRIEIENKISKLTAADEWNVNE